MRISYANYQFWIFVVGGGLLALAVGRSASSPRRTTAPYQLGMAIDPSYAHGHYNLGVAYQQADDLDRALESYRRAELADPRDHSFCLNHAQVARWLGHLDEAFAAARCAVAFDDSDGIAHAELGRTLLERGGTTAAAKALERALELRPFDATLRVDLGTAYGRMARCAEAEREWRAAVIADPSLGEAWINLGLLAQGRCGRSRGARSSGAPP